MTTRMKMTSPPSVAARFWRSVSAAGRSPERTTTFRRSTTSTSSCGGSSSFVGRRRREDCSRRRGRTVLVDRCEDDQQKSDEPDEINVWLRFVLGIEERQEQP